MVLKYLFIGCTVLAFVFFGYKADMFSSTDGQQRSHGGPYAYDRKRKKKMSKTAQIGMIFLCVMLIEFLFVGLVIDWQETQQTSPTEDFLYEQSQLQKINEELGETEHAARDNAELKVNEFDIVHVHSSEAVIDPVQVLFIVDSPNWAHDFKTKSLLNCFSKNEDFSNRFQFTITYDEKVKASQIQQADIVVLYYWLQITQRNKIHGRAKKALILNRHKIVMGISSHYEMDYFEDFRAESVKTIKFYARAIFTNNIFLFQQYSAVFSDPAIAIPVYYTPNGVNTTQFQEKPYSGESFANSHTSTKLRVGWTGSLSKEWREDIKGVQYVSDAVKMLRPDAVEYVGNSREQKWTSHDGMADFYERMDAYICASLYEGTPNPALEAASMGKALIATRVGNLPELIRPGYSGYFIPRNASHIAKMLSVLSLNSEDLVPLYGARLRQEVAKSFEWCHQSENFMHMFVNVVRFPTPSHSHQTNDVIRSELARLSQESVGTGHVPVSDIDAESPNSPMAGLLDMGQSDHSERLEAENYRRHMNLMAANFFPAYKSLPPAHFHSMDATIDKAMASMNSLHDIHGDRPIQLVLGANHLFGLHMLSKLAMEAEKLGTIESPIRLRNITLYSSHIHLVEFSRLIVELVKIAPTRLSFIEKVFQRELRPTHKPLRFENQFHYLQQPISDHIREHTIQALTKPLQHHYEMYLDRFVSQLHYNNMFEDVPNLSNIPTHVEAEHVKNAQVCDHFCLIPTWKGEFDVPTNAIHTHFLSGVTGMTHGHKEDSSKKETIRRDKEHLIHTFMYEKFPLSSSTYPVKVPNIASYESHMQPQFMSLNYGYGFLESDYMYKKLRELLLKPSVHIKYLNFDIENQDLRALINTSERTFFHYQVPEWMRMDDTFNRDQTELIFATHIREIEQFIHTNSLPETSSQLVIVSPDLDSGSMTHIEKSHLAYTHTWQLRQYIEDYSIGKTAEVRGPHALSHTAETISLPMSEFSASEVSSAVLLDDDVRTVFLNAVVTGRPDVAAGELRSLLKPLFASGEVIRVLLFVNNTECQSVHSDSNAYEDLGGSSQTSASGSRRDCRGLRDPWNGLLGASPEEFEEAIGAAIIVWEPFVDRSGDRPLLFVVLDAFRPGTDAGLDDDVDENAQPEV